MPLTIVMYHYVRPIAGSRFPGIKGRELHEFDAQLDHVSRNYTVVGFADVLDALRGGKPLPTNACILTFDDGLRDHYVHVFPRLRARGWRGAFFPPAAPPLRGTVLDVQKIQHVIAAAPDPDALASTLLRLLNEAPERQGLRDPEAMYRELAVPSRFDPGSTVFVKRMLQRDLPPTLRHRIAGRLFAELITRDEAGFSAELYMSLDEIAEMAAGGMEIGGHGDTHVWLGASDEALQAQEFGVMMQFLARVHGGPPVDWVMCYPYGSYNPFTLDLVSAHGGVFGLTTVVGRVESFRRPLELPRLDTNDLPVQ
jgi:peptidoglycan/xylan/chitin deacetylase (PgdA/CDA1 family)